MMSCRPISSAKKPGSTDRTPSRNFKNSDPFFPVPEFGDNNTVGNAPEIFSKKSKDALPLLVSLEYVQQDPLRL